MRGGRAPDTIQRFLALGLPAAIRAPLAHATAHLRRPEAGLRATPPAGWHVTLAFLGQVDDAQARASTEVLGSVLASAAPRPAPRLQVREAGRFGDRVLFLALEEEPAHSLARFVTELHAELRAVGLEVPDRAFRPHITLARARGRRRVRGADVAGVQLPALQWRPTAVGRWASVPDDGAPYTVEAELPWPGAG